jgi:hypothetical protein
MRTRHHSFKEKILAILGRVAELWARAFLLLVALPALDPKRLQTREDVDALERDLFKADAHISRAIYKTARHLAGLPRIPCPIEAFYRPKLKSPRHMRWLYLNCTHKLHYARRLAIRMARRWKHETERRARDPLCDLRGSADQAIAACLAQLHSGCPDGLPRRSAAKAGGGSPTGILGARAPPVGCMKRSDRRHLAPRAPVLAAWCIPASGLHAPYGRRASFTATRALRKHQRGRAHKPQLRTISPCNPIVACSKYHVR